MIAGFPDPIAAGITPAAVRGLDHAAWVRQDEYLARCRGPCEAFYCFRKRGGEYLLLRQGVEEVPGRMLFVSGYQPHIANNSQFIRKEVTDVWM